MTVLNIFIAVFINFAAVSDGLVNAENNSYTLSGKIVESTSGEELTGVEIEVIGTGEKYYTDFEGEFQIPCKDKNAKISIRIHYISYKKQIIRDLSPDNDNFIIKLQNTSEPVMKSRPRANPKT